MVRDLPAANYGCVSGTGLDYKGDQLRYNTASARLLGQRYAEKMQTLLASPRN